MSIIILILFLQSLVFINFESCKINLIIFYWCHDMHLNYSLYPLMNCFVLFTNMWIFFKFILMFTLFRLQYSNYITLIYDYWKSSYYNFGASCLISTQELLMTYPKWGLRVENILFYLSKPYLRHHIIKGKFPSCMNVLQLNFEHDNSFFLFNVWLKFWMVFNAFLIFL